METKKFKCSKCGNVATLEKEIVKKWNGNKIIDRYSETTFHNDCNCGWVYMKEVQ